jgi:hypothetical protein
MPERLGIGLIRKGPATGSGSSKKKEVFLSRSRISVGNTL